MGLFALLHALPFLVVVACAVVGVYGYLVSAGCESYEILVEGDGCTVVADGILLVTVHSAGGPTFDYACALVALLGIKVRVDDV